MKVLQIWFAIGLVMIFVQIIIGGVTRLTGSGLSITRWEIVTGTVPPMNDNDWEVAFSEYKQTPQYAKLNDGMSVKEFKFIYFWEYVHRLWARLMGFVFVIPFVYFIWKGWLRGKLLVQTFFLFFLAALVASFGWIMVASGLIDRPWVNTYKLTLHLSMAILTFLYLLYLFSKTTDIRKIYLGHRQKNVLIILFVLVSFQIILGGVVSGSKAALAFPTWPSMHGEWIPSVLWDVPNWTWSHFIQYDTNPFFPAVVQFVHRSVAYILSLGILVWVFWVKGVGDKYWRKSNYALLFVLIAQVCLGVLTLVNSVGDIPVLWGVLHQGVGILLLSIVFHLLYRVLMIDSAEPSGFQ